MSKYDVKFVEELTKQEFNYKLRDKELIIGPHALDHLSARQRKVFKDRGRYEMVLYFTDEAINRIRKSWEDTNLPQECIITSSFNKLDFRKKDFFEKKLPYPTIYLQL